MHFISNISKYQKYLDVLKGKAEKWNRSLVSEVLNIRYAKQECKALISASFRYVDQEIKEILGNNHIKQEIILLQKQFKISTSTVTSYYHNPFLAELQTNQNIQTYYHPY